VLLPTDPESELKDLTLAWRDPDDSFVSFPTFARTLGLVLDRQGGDAGNRRNNLLFAAPHGITSSGDRSFLASLVIFYHIEN
jgi:hypothetical protein